MKRHWHHEDQDSGFKVDPVAVDQTPEFRHKVSGNRIIRGKGAGGVRGWGEAGSAVAVAAVDSLVGVVSWDSHSYVRNIEMVLDGEKDLKNVK